MPIHRLKIVRQVREAIDQAARRQDLFTLLIVHLSGIAAIREHLGYDSADVVVRTAIDRLSLVMDKGDRIGRLADDEIAIISYDCNSPSCAIKGSRRCLEVLGEPVTIESVDCPLLPHVGIAIYPIDGQQPQTLLKHALSAVRLAERADTDPRYAFYSHELGQRAIVDFAMQQELRVAISRGKFALYLQPKICLDTGAVIGAEALIRWPQTDGTVRSPAQFLTVAERGRLMRPLGNWVTREACRILSDWRSRDLTAVPLAINVSAEQFLTDDWLGAWEMQLDASAIAPSSLIVEITESVAMAGDPDTLSRLTRLRARGTHLSIDDFGVGFSNLAMLTRFAFDEVKIDISLVQQLGQENAARSIVKAICQMGGDLGMRVLAEGVETETQADVLRTLGCTHVQGYFYGRPVPADEFERLWMHDTSRT